jgi:hypothetical protein
MIRRTPRLAASMRFWRDFRQRRHTGVQKSGGRACADQLDAGEFFPCLAGNNHAAAGD